MQFELLAPRALTGVDQPGGKLYPLPRSYVHSPITCVHPERLTPLSFTEVNRDADRWQAYYYYETYTRTSMKRVYVPSEGTYVCIVQIDLVAVSRLG